jgi:hypothetical protein
VNGLGIAQALLDQSMCRCGVDTPSRRRILFFLQEILRDLSAEKLVLTG